jgi:hypothetical protein
MTHDISHRPFHSVQAEPRVYRAERRIDDELAQSFPASDPPSWTLGTTTAPDRRDSVEPIRR